MAIKIEPHNTLFSALLLLKANPIKILPGGNKI